MASRLAEVRRARRHGAGGDPDVASASSRSPKDSEPEPSRPPWRPGLPDVGRELRPGAARQGGGPTARTVRWHFLGPVQRNKVKRLAPLVSRLARHRPAGGRRRGGGSQSGRRGPRPGQRDRQAGRRAAAPRRSTTLVEHCRQRPLSLSGLMAVGPEGDLERSPRVLPLAGSSGPPAGPAGAVDGHERRLRGGRRRRAPPPSGWGGSFRSPTRGCGRCNDRLCGLVGGC